MDELRFIRYHLFSCPLMVTKMCIIMHNMYDFRIKLGLFGYVTIVN
jgi:hypothetical protein